MSTEIAVPVGIDQASEPCWFPMDGTEQAFEWGEGTPHWTTIEAANEGMATIVDEHVADGLKHPGITLHRESEGCWHLTCAECGYRYDEDEWVSHFPDRAEADRAAEDCDWQVVDGRLLCPECVDGGAR
jgi:rubredoxin